MRKEILEYAKTRYDAVRADGDGFYCQNKCWRCHDGTYYWGASVNGSRGTYSGPCYRCNGEGWDAIKRIKNAERWYKARLRADAKAEEKRAAREAEYEAGRAARNAEAWAKAILLMRLEAGKAEALEKITAASKWVGEVGEKIEVGAVLAFKKWIEGIYGRSLLLVFVTDDGAKLKAFYAGAADKILDLEIQEKVTVLGTVKKLDKYNGEKQTIITRVRVKA